MPIGKFTKIIADDNTPTDTLILISIFVRDSHFNVDLSDHGNATPGTPVTIWGKWEGENQVWRFEQV